MGSGLIYAVIIVMWGAYFIPLWLRRHEERSEARSVDRFSSAMRVLSGRQHADDEEQSPPQPAPAPPLAARAAGRRTPRRSKAARSLALRRRRVLAGLLVVTVAVAVAVPFSPLPWTVHLVPLCVTLAYLVHLRVQARRSHELSRTRSSMRRRTLARLRRFDSAERIFQARRTLRDEHAASEAARASAHDAVDAGTPDAGWQPVPVPLPTYVTKPVAPRAQQQRVQDDVVRQEPFDQTAGVAGGAPAAPGGSRYAAQLVELDELMQRRAVND